VSAVKIQIKQAKAFNEAHTVWIEGKLAYRFTHPAAQEFEHIARLIELGSLDNIEVELKS
jgi:hypothetical protein